MASKGKKHILVVDDEPTWLQILTQFLTSRGYAVVTAGSGTEALRALSGFTPDLILSDVRMPDMNGFELLESIKKLPATKSTPVVFLSAIDDYDARKIAKELGAMDYLVKPFDEGDVSSLLQKHLPQ